MAKYPSTVRITIQTDAGTASVECPVLRHATDETVTFDATALVQQLATLTLEQIPTLSAELDKHPDARPRPWLGRMLHLVLARLRDRFRH